MRRCYILWCVLIGSAVLAGREAHATDDTFPFHVGERLIYEISWSGFVGGEAVIRINEKIVRDGANVFLISTAAQSTGLVRTLYPIEDLSLSYFDVDCLCSLGSDVRISENDYRKHTQITFDHKKGIAIYHVNQEDPQEYPISANTNDAFSAFYAFRARYSKIEPKESVRLPVFDDRRQHELVATALRREKIWLKDGSINAMAIRFSLPSSGLFQSQGDMTIWFSDDAAFAPVKIEAAAPIGKFTMLLKSWENLPLQITPYRRSTP